MKSKDTLKKNMSIRFQVGQSDFFTDKPNGLFYKMTLCLPIRLLLYKWSQSVTAQGFQLAVAVTLNPQQ